MAESNLDIRIGAKGVGETVAGFAAVTGSLRELGGEVFGMKMLLEEGPLGALNLLIDGFRELIKVVAEGETAENNLRNALKVAGDAAGETLGPMKEYAEQIERQTTLSHAAVEQAMALGASMGGFVGKQLEDVTTAAIGLSERMQIDLHTAMQLVVRAGEGNTQMLKRYGIVLDASLSPQEKFNKLLQVGAESFSMAAGRANTMEGAWNRLKNLFDSMLEGLGGVLAGPITEGVNLLTSAVEGARSGIAAVGDYLAPIRDQFVETFAAVKSAVFDAFGPDVWAAIKSALHEFADVMRSVFAEMRNDAVAVLATIEYVAKHFKDGSLEGLSEFVSAKLTAAQAKMKSAAESSGESALMDQTKATTDPSKKATTIHVALADAVSDKFLTGIKQQAEEQMALLKGQKDPVQEGNQINKSGWDWLKGGGLKEQVAAAHKETQSAVAAHGATTTAGGTPALVQQHQAAARARLAREREEYQQLLAQDIGQPITGETSDVTRRAAAARRRRMDALAGQIGSDEDIAEFGSLTKAHAERGIFADTQRTRRRVTAENAEAVAPFQKQLHDLMAALPAMPAILGSGPGTLNFRREQILGGARFDLFKAGLGAQLHTIGEGFALRGRNADRTAFAASHATSEAGGEDARTARTTHDLLTRVAVAAETMAKHATQSQPQKHSVFGAA